MRLVERSQELGVEHSRVCLVQCSWELWAVPGCLHDSKPLGQDSLHLTVWPGDASVLPHCRRGAHEMGRPGQREPAGRSAFPLAPHLQLCNEWMQVTSLRCGKLGDRRAQQAQHWQQQAPAVCAMGAARCVSAWPLPGGSHCRLSPPLSVAPKHLAVESGGLPAAQGAHPSQL